MKVKLQKKQDKKDDEGEAAEEAETSQVWLASQFLLGGGVSFPATGPPAAAPVPAAPLGPPTSKTEAALPPTCHQTQMRLVLSR